MSKKEEMNAAWLAWLADEDLPARATIGVADLGDPRRLIEVTAIAAVKDK
jgi:enamine deaminase RidA (YjgF/YER057c/UK114 family)